MCSKMHCVYSSRLEYFLQLAPGRRPFDYWLFSFFLPFLKSRLSSGLRILLMFLVLTCVYIIRRLAIGVTPKLLNIKFSQVCLFIWKTPIREGYNFAPRWIFLDLNSGHQITLSFLNIREKGCKVYLSTHKLS